MKILTILGARPQFIKAGSVSRAIARVNSESPITNHQSLYLYGGGKASEKIIKGLLSAENE